MITPKTLAEVAKQSPTGMGLAEAFNSWRTFARGFDGPALLAAMAVEPPRMARSFDDESQQIRGQLADSFLEAYAEECCRLLKVPAPAWVHRKPGISLRQRYNVQEQLHIMLAAGSTDHLELDPRAVGAFKQRRLLQLPFKLPIRPKMGRPRTLTDEQRRQANRERQRRFRARQ